MTVGLCAAAAVLVGAGPPAGPYRWPVRHRSRPGLGAPAGRGDPRRRDLRARLEERASVGAGRLGDPVPAVARPPRRGRERGDLPALPARHRRQLRRRAGARVPGGRYHRPRRARPAQRPGRRRRLLLRRRSRAHLCGRRARRSPAGPARGRRDLPGADHQRLAATAARSVGRRPDPDRRPGPDRRPRRAETSSGAGSARIPPRRSATSWFARRRSSRRSIRRRSWRHRPLGAPSGSRSTG